jgi:signal transduction histidine kinase
MGEATEREHGRGRVERPLASGERAGAGAAGPFAVVLGVLLLLLLYLLSRTSYLLFHGLAELFSICVAFATFAVAWNCRKLLRDNYLVLVGIAYLAVAAVDTLHTLAYPGMGVFVGGPANRSTQLWIAARALEAGSLLLGALLIGHRIRPMLTVAAYILVSYLLVSAVFVWRVFPTCYVEVEAGRPLTTFKVTAEYVICVVLAVTGVVLWTRRRRLDRAVLWLLVGSVAFTIASELAFTLYRTPTDTMNALGHFLKIASFYLVYRAIIQTGLVKPYALLFRDLAQSEESLRRQRSELEAVLRHLPVGVLIVEAPSGKTLMVNTALEAILRAPFRMCETIEDYGVYKAFRADGRMYEPAEWPHARSLLTGETVSNEEIRALRADGAMGIFVLNSAPVRDDAGDIVAAVAAVHDVTEQRRMEDAVRDAHRELEVRVRERTAALASANQTLYAEAAERARARAELEAERERLFAILNELPALVFTVATDHTIGFANAAFRERLGSPEGRTCHGLFAGSPDPCVHCRTFDVLSLRDLYEWEWTWPNGLTYRYYDYPFSEPDGTPVVLKLAVDVTEQREASRRLEAHEAQLRSLASELSLAEERERRRVASALHDNLGQTLATSKMKLGTLASVSGSQQVRDGAREIAELIADCIEYTRNLTFELGSPVLYELGLEAALESLVERTEHEHGMRGTFQDDRERKPLSNDARVVLFQAAKELIVNVVKHAGATRFHLSVNRRDTNVRITVEDNGVGFDVADLDRRERVRAGFGLFSIRERLSYLGGGLDVRSEPGGGTSVSLTAPLAES